MKVTIYQKNINQFLTKPEIQKLKSHPSDFLIFPFFYPHMDHKTLEEWSSQFDQILDHFLEISEVYPGVILGGSIPQKVNGQILMSTPIVQNVQHIDSIYYNSKIPFLLNHSEESEYILILNGYRFAVCLFDQIHDAEYLRRIKEESIQILFHLDFREKNSSYEDELKSYSQWSKDLNCNIFKVSGTGKMNDKLGYGISLLATPTGINWKVGASETDKEILKTINLNLSNNLFSNL
jgi:hypothetical protein